MSLTLKTTYLSPVTVFSGAAVLASGSNAISTAVDFRQSNAPVSGYVRGYFVLSAPAFSTAPAANTAIYLYWLRSVDGGSTNFETDPGRSTTPAFPPRATFPFDGGTTVSTAAWSRASDVIDLPPVPALLIVLNSSGQSLAAAWSLTFVPVSTMGV